MTIDPHHFLYQEHQPQRAGERPADPAGAPATVGGADLPRDTRSVAHMLHTRSVVQTQPPPMRHDHLTLAVPDEEPRVALRQRILRVVLISSLLGVLCSALLGMPYM